MAFELINTRCKKILYMIIAENHYITLEKIAAELNLSKRSIYYEICKINEWLESCDLPELEVTRGKGIHLELEMKQKIENMMESGKEEDSYIFSPTERVRVIICYIINTEEPIYIEQLADYCRVSRNTVFNDLRVVVNQLQDYNLKLEYESKKGYQIAGDTIRIRALFFLYFNMLRPLFNSGILKFINKNETYEYLKRLEAIEKGLHTDYVDGILLSLAALMPIMHRDDQKLYFPGLRQEELESTKEYQLIETYFSELCEKEKIYLCLHLLGSRVTVVSNDIFEERSNQTVYEVSKALVAEFEKVACVIFEDKEELERALFIHVNSSLYRYQYGVQIGNPLGEDIIREYPNLFDITKIACKYLEQQIGLPISDSEIAYLALHFGAYLQAGKKVEENLRVLIVCVNGVSTGNMLRRELSQLLPRVKIVDVVAASDIVNVHNICDLVISTVNIQSLVPMIVVHPILTDLDRKSILGHPLICGQIRLVDTDALFDVVKKYVNKADYADLKRDLIGYFSKDANHTEISLMRRPQGLCDLLANENVLVTEEPMKWEAALRYAGTPLVEQGNISTSYIEKIIAQIRYYGPYMFITPDVVLAHAKPEDGVVRLGVSACVFKKPIYFSQFHEAKVIIVLAAEDQERHLKVLKDIMTIFGENEYADTLQEIDASEDVIAYFQKITD